MEASLDRAAQLLNRRQIDMSLPPPTSSAASPPIRKTTAVAAAAKAAAAAAPPQPGKRKMPTPQEPPRGKRSTASITTAHATGNGSSADEVTPRDRAVDRDRRLARSAAFNNRAALLVTAGRGEEACRLLRACLLLLPEEPRPVFNLALALWRLGRRRAACVHWLEARNWLGGGGRGGGGGAGGGSEGGGGRESVEEFTKLLDSARRRKVGLWSETTACAREV